MRVAHTIDPGKYTVIKTDDLEGIFGVFNHRGDERVAAIMDAIGQAKIADAVVIRRQDHFAPAALHGYAFSIMVALSVMDKATPVREKLQAVADYFHEQAVLAEAEAHKVPD